MMYEGSAQDGRSVKMLTHDLDAPPGSDGKPTSCTWDVDGETYRTEGRVGSLDVEVFCRGEHVHSGSKSHLHALLEALAIEDADALEHMRDHG